MTTTNPFTRAAEARQKSEAIKAIYDAPPFRETQTYFRVLSWARPYNGDVVRWFDNEAEADQFAFVLAVNTGRGTEIEKVER